MDVRQTRLIDGKMIAFDGDPAAFDGVRGPDGCDMRSRHRERARRPDRPKE